MPRSNKHPTQILEALGISERPASFAVGFLVILQYIFITKLWLGYPIKGVNDFIHMNVVVVCAVLSLGGSFIISWYSLHRWRSGAAAAKRLDRLAKDPSFSAISNTLIVISSRSTLSNNPNLFYTPKNLLALEVRETSGANQAVVVGLGQRNEQRSDPAAFEAKIGHEVSHLELSKTQHEIWTRRLVTLHFRVFGWLVVTFLLVLGFIDSRGLGSITAFAGFFPVFDFTIYVRLSAHIAILLLTSVVVFIYSYFFMVRREHIHDVRGSQLAGTTILAERVFQPKADTRVSARFVNAIIDFFTLHPTFGERRRVVLARDFILLSPILYPTIIAGILPLSQLLTAGWLTEFGIEQHWWGLGQTIATGSILFMVLSADVTRLGLGVLLSKHFWYQVPIYALITGLATQIPRFILQVIYGLREGFSLRIIITKVWEGSSVGSLNNSLMVATLIMILVILSTVRIAALGEERGDHWQIAHKALTLLIAVGAFTVSSLSSLQFIIDTLVVLGIVAVGYVLLTISLIRCRVCGRRRLTAVAFQTCCSCGHDHLALLRWYWTKPYDQHLDDAASACIR